VAEFLPSDKHALIEPSGAVAGRSHPHPRRPRGRGDGARNLTALRRTST